MAKEPFGCVLFMITLCLYCQEDLGGQSLIPEDKMRELLKKQHDCENDLAKKMEQRRQRQLDNLNNSLAHRRQDRLNRLQQEQEQERAEVSEWLPHLSAFLGSPRYTLHIYMDMRRACTHSYMYHAHSVLRACTLRHVVIFFPICFPFSFKIIVFV